MRIILARPSACAGDQRSPACHVIPTYKSKNWHQTGPRAPESSMPVPNLPQASKICYEHIQVCPGRPQNSPNSAPRAFRISAAKPPTLAQCPKRCLKLPQPSCQPASEPEKVSCQGPRKGSQKIVAKPNPVVPSPRPQKARSWRHHRSKQGAPLYITHGSRTPQS